MRTLRLAPVQLTVALALLVAALGACTSAPEPSRAAAPAASGAAPSAAGSQPAAPAPAAQAPSTPPAVETVKMSYVNALDNAPLFVGVDRGYWQEQGVELELTPVQSSADAIAFLANGQLDTAMGSIAVPLFNAVNQGMDVRIIAPVAYSYRTAVLVRKDLYDSAAVRSVADLKGKRIFSVAP